MGRWNCGMALSHLQLDFPNPESVNFHLLQFFLSNSYSCLSLISQSLIGSLNIRLVPWRFILLLWSVTLAALHRGARIMRVVAGRQTGLTSQLRPSLSWLRKNVNTEALCFMDYLLQQNYSERNTTLACHVASVLFNVRDHSPKQQRSKLEAVFFVCFFSVLSLLTSRFSFLVSSDRSGLNTVIWCSLIFQSLLFYLILKSYSFGFWADLRRASLQTQCSVCPEQSRLLQTSCVN